MMLRQLLRLVALAVLCAGVAHGAEDADVDYLDLAALMLRDGNLDRALIALDQVDTTEEGLDLLRFYTLRGLTHLRRSEPAPAADALQQAVATGQAEAVVYVYLAQARFSQEKYREVLNTLDQAGPELARVPSIYHMRAQCHWLLQEPGMALAVLDQVGAVFSDDPSFQRRKVFFLMDLGLYREAADQGRDYLARSEGKLEDYVAMGNAMRAAGELDEAVLLLEQARLRYPGDVTLNKVLAHTYIDRGQLNAAADLVFEAALLDPVLTSEAVELYRRAGRLQRALMLNAQISDQETKLRQRMALLLELQRFEQAALMRRDLTRLGLLEDQDVRYALAYATFKTGDFDTTETLLQPLSRPDLFRKAAELRSAMADCAEDAWQCL
jgi:tetratricopeptide (TPR) repeat protein